MFSSFYQSLGLPIWLIIIASVWTLVWKGFALWKSASLNHPIWFIILLIVNTLGILEILYIFLFSEINLDDKLENKRQRKNEKKSERKNKRRKR